MTDTIPLDVSRQHAHAIADLVTAALAPLQEDGRYTVFFGEVTTAEADTVYPYLVVWPSPGFRPTNTNAGYDGALTTTTQITAAGASADEVLAALDRAALALHRRRPTILGRRCSPISQVPGSQPPQPERDDTVHTPTGRSVFSSFALFSLYSTPAGGTTT